MGLTTILTTIWVCPPKSGTVQNPYLQGKIGRPWTCSDVLPMSGGQGVASSNLASPTIPQPHESGSDLRKHDRGPSRSTTREGPLPAPSHKGSHKRSGGHYSAAAVTCSGSSRAFDVDAAHGLVRNGCGISCRCASRTPLGFPLELRRGWPRRGRWIHHVSPYGSEEGIGYGEGRGTATGRIEGTVVWSNYPRRRTDGRMLPNVRGLITTQDGALILFEFRGRTIFEGDEPGRQNLVGWFESDHESYRWLNDLVCIAEGEISAAGPDMVINVYAGIHEM